MKCVALILFTLASLMCSIRAGDLGSLISPSMFNEMLKHRNDGPCPGKWFYSYDAFINAAKSFHSFGTTGDWTTRKRELAAFFGQTSHETTGGWAGAPDGPFAWGYCFIIKEQGNSGGGYYGRGPIQLTYKHNYEKAGKAIGVDLVKNPELVATNPTISFKTAIWFWMTPQWHKPSSHDVITGRWNPTSDDWLGRRLPGYGVITNIINGGLECGQGLKDSVHNRNGFYERYCDMFGVSYGDNEDCKDQKPFG